MRRAERARARSARLMVWPINDPKRHFTLKFCTLQAWAHHAHSNDTHACSVKPHCSRESRDTVVQRLPRLVTKKAKTVPT